MPTGLTSKIYEGKKITLREFALKCAGNLSPGYYYTRNHDKDLPLLSPPVLKVDNYRQESLERAKKELERYEYLKANPSEMQKLYDKEKTRLKLDKMAREIDIAKKRERYDAMIEKVEQWEVPERFQSLKDYMLKQLNDSRDFDCPDLSDIPVYEPTIDEWIDGCIKSCKRRMEYDIEEIEKERQWYEGANEYLKELYSLLDETAPI